MLKSFKKILILFILISMLSQTVVFASGKYEDSYYEDLKTEKEIVLEDVREQLIAQDKMEHYHHYENLVEEMYQNKIDMMNGYRSSSYYAPNGGIAYRENEYATSVDVYVPNDDINDVIVNSSLNVSQVIIAVLGYFLPNRILATIGTLGTIQSFGNNKMLEKFKNEGDGAIISSYIDHTEGDRGSMVIIRWNTYPNINSNGVVIVK